jgi:hypothetical protein
MRVQDIGFTGRNSSAATDDSDLPDSTRIQ